MKQRPARNMFNTLRYYLKTLVLNYRAKRLLKKEKQLTAQGAPRKVKSVPGIIILDADNAAGVRQFVSYNPKTRSYYAEAVIAMQIRNQEFVWPPHKDNIWKALEQCDRMSDDILRVLAPELKK